MKMTAIGRAALKSREGERLTAYRCSAGVLTIGVGHTSAAGEPKVRPGMRITAAESDAIFARDLGKYERPVAAALKVPVADHEFDALVSLAFNVGAGAIVKSTILRRLNAGDGAGAAEAFLMWRKPPEILDRRKGEYDQFRVPYDKALPRARRSDKAPVKIPLGAPVPEFRQPDDPGPAPKPPLTDVNTPAPQPAPSGGLFSALGAALRRAFPKG